MGGGIIIPEGQLFHLQFNQRQMNGSVKMLKQGDQSTKSWGKSKVSRRTKLIHRAGEAAFTSFCGHGILGDCVASTMHSRLYFTPTKVRYPSELGRLRDTLQTREKILACTRIRTRDLRLASRTRCRSATVPHNFN